MDPPESQSESVGKSAPDSTLGTIDDLDVGAVGFDHSTVSVAARCERSHWDGESVRQVVLERNAGVPHWQPSWRLLDAAQRVQLSIGPPKLGNRYFPRGWRRFFATRVRLLKDFGQGDEQFLALPFPVLVVVQSLLVREKKGSGPRAVTDQLTACPHFAGTISTQAPARHQLAAPLLRS